MKITAYQLMPKALELVPGEKERQWMDDTPYRFAYRCLPLSIANSTGWDILCPEDFMVTWSGGHAIKDVTVHIDGYPWKFAASNFGSGIVTIHPGYIFRTEPGWNLLVTGSPNYQCDFMQPLTGIVETWWLDFTFTMNWKLDKPGTYTIPKGMPLCRILPVPDYSKLDIEASIKPIHSNPELHDSYKEWSQSRSKLINDMNQAFDSKQKTGNIDPNDPKTHWEKNYMRGVDKSGKKEYNHTTSLKFPKFK